MAKTGRRQRRKKKFDVKDVFTRGLKSDYSQQFQRLFLGPFTRVLEGDISAGAAIDYFFNVLTRDIFFAKVNEGISMPGKRYIAGSRLADGETNRNIREGTILVVRVDSTQPYVDVEYVFKHESFVYRLTESEYRWLQTKTTRMT